MTLTSAIIKSAYRESNLVAINAAPSSNQITEAVDRLNVVVAGVYGNEVGDPFLDWPVGIEDLIVPTGWSQAQWIYPLINTRLIASSDSAQELWLPPNPPPGARVALIDPAARLAAAPITINGNGRTIEGAQDITINTNGATRVWFYRDDLGDWVLLSALTGTDPEQFPFPLEFDDFFITRLAMRINPRYGRSMDESTVAEMAMVLNKLRARYTTPTNIPADYGVLALTNMPRRAGQNFGDSPGRFIQYNIVAGRMGWMP
jgi:hypothetical protein